MQKPLTASIQVSFQQGFGIPQFYTYGQPVAPPPSGAADCYQRGSELQGLRRFADALASFDRAIALKPDYAEAHNSRGIALINLGRPDAALAAFDQAIALKSDYAEACNNRGLVLQELKRNDEALASFSKAVGLKPDNARVRNNLGVVLRELGRLDDALSSCDQAIALQPDYAQAHYNRALVLQDLDRLDDAVAGFKRAIERKPDYAEAYNNIGVVLQELNRSEEALSAYDKVSALGADYEAEANFNRSYCLLRLGRLEEGFRLHEWRKKLNPPIGHRSFAQPLWSGREDITGKTVFVHWEQGFGDTLQFCRYGGLLEARGANVTMSVQEPLYRLLQGCSPAIEIVNQHEVPAAFDYHCALMSLPFAFGTTLTTIPADRPYIHADDRLRIAWQARLPAANKPRIGVVWSGSAKQKNDRNRSVGLAALTPIFAADAHWITLQKEFREGDSALLAKLPQIVCCGSELNDFADTAALLDGLDLLITVDTSVAHLAGAMGKPVWIMVAHNADWRWLLDRDDSPWYPTARLFRQQERNSWHDVVVRVQAALDDFMRSRQ